MKLLFICSHDFNKVSGGGSQCTNRNYKSICEIFGAKNVNVIQLEPKLKKTLFNIIERLRNYLLGFDAGLSKKTINTIVKESKNYDYIFIDSSKYGILSSFLKKNHYNGQIICFFHNVEYKLFIQRTTIQPLEFWKRYIIYNNEKNVLKHADKIIVLNDRDLFDLKIAYNKKDIPNASIIPISFEDKSPEITFFKSIEETNLPPTFLFVGDDWFANIHGIEWFIKNVLNKVNIKLQIAGKSSEVLKKKFTHSKIEFLGFVPDLTSVIMNADFVLAPIFKGGGMKVKICEALMYGKNIIGTTEAFNGYDVDYNKVGAICNHKNEFVKIIDNYSFSRRKKYNMYNRNCFLKKYSYKSTLEKFSETLLRKVSQPN